MLKAHREDVEGDMRDDAPLRLGAGPNCRVCALRQALQTNLDDAILGKNMLEYQESHKWWDGVVLHNFYNDIGVLLHRLSDIPASV